MTRPPVGTIRALLLPPPLRFFAENAKKGRESIRVNQSAISSGSAIIPQIVLRHGPGKEWKNACRDWHHMVNGAVCAQTR